MLRVRNTLFFENVNGAELCKIQQRLVVVRDTMTIEGPNNETLATVKKALITPVRDRWTVKVGNGPDLEVQGRSQGRGAGHVVARQIVRIAGNLPRRTHVNIADMPERR